jgi:hypothetical protein
LKNRFSFVAGLDSNEVVFVFAIFRACSNRYPEIGNKKGGTSFFYGIAKVAQGIGNDLWSFVGLMIQ